MANLLNLSTLLLIISSFVAFLTPIRADERKVYIVYMGGLGDDNYSPTLKHNSLLQEVLEDRSASDYIIHSYKKSFNGFAANLTEKEVQKLGEKEGIVSIFPNKKYKLLTTKSWDFVGLTEKVKRIPTAESDIIVGMLDSGVWPESDSFSDEGFGPPPKKWKGQCAGGKNFTCNNKLIGARAYHSESARDDGQDSGHGTHTASTVAGVPVNNVSWNGLAQGTARGGVPSARIAVYKVCNEDGCDGASVLAAFDDAISDGVDILSVSLGPEYASDYLDDSIAIGSFHAMQKGILTSQAAGNKGPSHETLGSIAPWIVTVAASSIDRKFESKVILGDNTTITGYAVNAFETTKFSPLVKHKDPQNAGKIVHQNATGKIVFYDRFSLEGPLGQNATGMIVVKNDWEAGYSWSYPMPATALSRHDAAAINSYISKNRNPFARILKSESMNDTTAPVVTSFSSRGPDSIRKHILKPDISAPGANILAAWSPAGSPTILGDPRSVKYNIISGTSMACPHVSGAAAYVKSFNPNWSPAAIKSALLTTATPMNAASNPEAEFAYGAGQINPAQAVNPGLVYDANEFDYINALCSFYTPDQIKLIAGPRAAPCPKVPVQLKDLNYPTFVSYNTKETFKRRVTNVGAARSTYKATVEAPSNVKVTVEPNVLTFTSLNEQKSFVVTVTAAHRDVNYQVDSAAIVWSDGVHVVRSPMAVHLPHPPK